MTLVVNLYAGPGTGKSSTMAEVFAKLKWAGVNAEMAPEFAKEKVWEGSLEMLNNQIYVFGKQLHTIRRVLGKVDVVITDSPLLLSILYGRKEGDEFLSLVAKKNRELDRLNVLLARVKKYNPSGRLQTEDEARGLDGEIRDILVGYGEDFVSLPACPDSSMTIFHMVMERLGKPVMPFGTA